MRVLVTGARGQLGHEVVRCFSSAGHEVIPTDRRSLDFARPDTIADGIARHSPELVVNCAAYTQVDRAEEETEAAFTVNRDAAGALAQAVADKGGRLLHVSTDFVFDGRMTQPYTETDAPNPLGAYGRSKLEGEQAVLQALPDAVVLRTAWVYGVHGHNFVKTMLRVAQAGKPLRVVDDQVGAPTWAADIAGVLLALGESDAAGMYHYTNAGSTSWHGFACAILEDAAALGFDIVTRTAAPIPTADYPTPAKRPAYSVLDTARITSKLGLAIPAWRDSLKKMLEELKSCEDCL